MLGGGGLFGCGGLGGGVGLGGDVLPMVELPPPAEDQVYIVVNFILLERVMLVPPNRVCNCIVFLRVTNF